MSGGGQRTAGGRAFARGVRHNLPDLPATPAQPILGIFGADLHLSLRPPSARSAEPDWLAAQRRVLEQLAQLKKKHQAPLILVGDIFNSACCPSELVNFALEHLPDCYCIYGNHDLPYHSPEQLAKSSFWTLVRAGKVTLLEPGKPTEIILPSPWRLWGFPFGVEAAPLAKPFDLAVEVAVIHAYVWKPGCGYRGAPEQARLGAFKAKLAGYDAVFFGDNHTPFTAELPHGPNNICSVINCGGLQRRKADERGHEASCWLLKPDGTVERQALDTTEERWLDASALEQILDKLGAETFIEELRSLGAAAVNFSDALKRILDDTRITPAVRTLVLQALEGGDSV